MMQISNTIDSLNIDDGISGVLKKNHVNIVEDLWSLKRKDLKLFGLNDSQISQIIIKLQLIGIDLNRKVYNKD